jgi:hypothetical protein
VLFNHAKAILSAECGGGKRISKQKPNDMIEYLADGRTSYGQVSDIVELLGGVNSIVVKVLTAQEVCRSDELDKHFRNMNVLHVQL